MNLDMEFIAGNFLYGDVPPGKEYLRHHFQTEMEAAFLSYYLIFYKLRSKKNIQNFYRNFCDHTGICCSVRWVEKLLIRVDKIETALEEASKNFDPTRVGDIKSG